MMKRFTYSGSLLAVAAAAFGGTAYGQQACDQQVERLQNRIQEQQLDQQLQQSIRQLLQTAESANAEDCRDIVAQIEQTLGSSTEIAESRSSGAENSSAQTSESQQARNDEDRTRVRVQQPPADVDIQTPQPDVDVNERQSQVTVDQKAPQIDVQVQQRKPDVQVQTPPPDVDVQQGQAQVNVDQPKPEVEIDQAKPNVDVEQSKPEVTVQRSEPDVEIQQSKPDVDVTVAKDGGRTASRSGTASGLTEEQAQQIVGHDIYSSEGKEIGEVSKIARSRSDDDLYALVDVGGFLGIGERTVAIPLDELQMSEEGARVSMSRQQIRQMQKIDPDRYASIDEGRTLR